jgi:hypothetical protein
MGTLFAPVAAMTNSTPGEASLEAAAWEADSARLELDQIARAAVQLAELSPRLASIAADMESNSQAQANSATAIAQTAETLVRNLSQAMAELTASSGKVEKTLAMVKRISDHTRLLSINASIEAARAAEAGKAFAVVVDEVSQLAHDTGRMTVEIGSHIGAMQSGVATVARMTGRGRDERDDEGSTIRAVNHQVRGMAASAQQQLGQAQSVHAMGAQINSLTESLLLAVGRFRFEAHARASEALATVLPTLSSAGTDRDACERALEQWLEEHPYFEMVYATGARGRQFVDNIGWRERRVVHYPSGLGKDWSDRPWFRAALESQSVCVTNLYRSAATGNYCFTVASALRADDRVFSVIGADVNFQRLISS